MSLLQCLAGSQLHTLNLVNATGKINLNKIVAFIYNATISDT